MAKGYGRTPGAAASVTTYVGSVASPITNASTARPSVAGPVQWMCANGITPTNAIAGDLIWDSVGGLSTVIA
jgi:hypothetical protein